MTSWPAAQTGSLWARRTRIVPAVGAELWCREGGHPAPLAETGHRQGVAYWPVSGKGSCFLAGCSESSSVKEKAERIDMGLALFQDGFPVQNKLGVQSHNLW